MQTVTPEHVGMSSARLGRIRPAVERYIDEGKFAGVITLVARQGEVAHFECMGQMDREAGKPMRPDALFRIYSMTKPVTSIALMMLVEEGRIRLDDPVSRFIPGFGDLRVFLRTLPIGFETAPLRREITVRDLLTHTAGLSYGGAEHPVDAMYATADVRNKEQTLEEFVAALVKLPLMFQPGTCWHYSVATDVVGRLVEIVSGKTLDAFFAERIFEPLGMVDTGFHVPPGKLDRLTTVYEYHADGSLTPLDTPQNSPFARPRPFLSGGGGLISTAADTLRFAQMLLNGGKLDGVRLVSRKTIELMTINHLRPEHLPFGYGEKNLGCGFGLGFKVILDLGLYGHIGSVGSYEWSGAANTAFWVDPQEKLIGLLLTQFMPAWHFRLTDDFRTLVYQAIDD